MVCVGRRGQINHFNEIIILLIVQIMHGRKQFSFNNLEKISYVIKKSVYLMQFFSVDMDDFSIESCSVN